MNARIKKTPYFSFLHAAKWPLSDAKFLHIAGMTTGFTLLAVSVAATPLFFFPVLAVFLLILGLALPKQLGDRHMFPFLLFILTVSGGFSCFYLSLYLLQGLGYHALDLPPFKVAFGEMSVLNALCILFLSAAILLRQKPQWIQASQGLSLAVFLVAYLILLSHAYEVEFAVTYPTSEPMSISFALSYMLLSLAVFLSTAEAGFAAIVMSGSSAGKLLRQLLPTAILAPSFIGWAGQIGEHYQIYDEEYGHAVVAAVTATLLSLFILRSARFTMDAEEHAIKHLEEVKSRDNQLRESESRFRSIFEQAAVGIGHVALDGTFLRVNRKFADITGYAVAEMCGRKFQDITFVEDLDEDLRLLQQVLQSEIQKYNLEKRYIRKNGSLVWVNLTVSLERSIEGEPAYFIAIVQDISDRKAAELELTRLKDSLELRVRERTEELSNTVHALEKEVCERCRVENELAITNSKITGIIEGTSDFIAAVDCDLNYIAINSAYKKEFHKVFKREVFLGQSVSSALEGFPEDRCKAMNLWRRALLGEKFTVVQPFGLEYNTYEINFSPIESSSGEVIGAAHIVRDVTDRVECERALTQSLEQEQQANLSKSIFLANMSHEIRTPIGVILGFAERLMQSHLPDTQRIHYGETIQRNGQNLLAIINDILDLSKVESGHLSVEKSSFNIFDLLIDVVAQMRLKANEKGLMMTWSSTGAIPEYIESDPTRLRQILFNLLSNAIKFTSRGKINAEMSLQAGNEKSILAIRVADTGVGIAGSNQAKLFKPFSQADGSVSRKYGGTGLGLSLSRQLAQLLGGDVALTESRVGEGSVFTLTIDPGPLLEGRFLHVTDPQAFERERVYHSQRKPMQRVDLTGVRILIAEDFEDNQKLLRSILEECHATVEFAANGEIAVEMALRQQYDLIIMDLQMPVMDGYAATQELRRHRYQKPIIAFTAHAMRGEMEHCLKIGFTDFLSKPASRSDLLAVVEKYRHILSAQVGAVKPSVKPLVSEYISDPSIAHALQIFISKLPERIAALEEMARTKDLEGIRRLAHQLKGAGGGYGFPDLTRYAALIESAHKIDKHLEERIAQLDSLCDRIQAGLNRNMSMWN